MTIDPKMEELTRRAGLSGGETKTEISSASKGNARKKPAFPLVAFKDIHLDLTQRNYCVKGLLPRSGLVVIWGPPKTYKSFWTMDLALHIACGWSYRGRRVQQTPV